MARITAMKIDYFSPPISMDGAIIVPKDDERNIELVGFSRTEKISIPKAEPVLRYEIMGYVYQIVVQDLSADTMAVLEFPEGKVLEGERTNGNIIFNLRGVDRPEILSVLEMEREIKKYDGYRGYPFNHVTDVYLKITNIHQPIIWVRTEGYGWKGMI